MSTIKKLDELFVSPAPWDVCDIVPLHGDGDPCGKWLVDGDRNDLVTELDGDGIDGITANARLISAAPELYEALRMYVEGSVCSRAERDCATCPNNLCVTKKARAALAKAGGEAGECE